MGGPMSVYEEEKYPFLRKEEEFLRLIIQREIPFLGICLGSQLLAKAKGAIVKKGVCKEIGYCSVELTPEGLRDPLFKGLGRKLEVFQWHEDELQIPEGGVLLARGERCINQALRWGKNAYGLQFHIEVSPQMVELWLKEDLKSKDKNKRVWAENILKETYRRKERFLNQANNILLNFAEIISADD